jgi:hypothetical protein
MPTPETNGRPPAAREEPDEAEPESPESPESPASAAIDLADFDPDLEDEELEDEDVAHANRSLGIDVAFTPRQILGGFALLAALILLLRRRNRRK